MIFILGKSPKHLESEITAEATRFDDMVQEDFADTFVNLTVACRMAKQSFFETHHLNGAFLAEKFRWSCLVSTGPSMMELKDYFCCGIRQASRVIPLYERPSPCLEGLEIIKCRLLGAEPHS